MSEEKKIFKNAYRITRIEIEKLKGIKKLDYHFGDKMVTAILGVNGCGKSTILHSLACVFRPKLTTSKEYNKLSDFFKSNTDENWIDSSFKVYFDYREQDFRKKPPQAPEKKSGSETYSKKSQSWSPKYSRRPVYESSYIGLQDIQTGADHPAAYRYRSYETTEFALEAAEQIKKDMVYILGRSYEKLNHHIVDGEGKNKVIMWGLELNGISYSELSMGSGEKRVLKILSLLHHKAFKDGGVLLIDELDALLHRASFDRIIKVLMRVSEDSRYPLQVFFTTHRETVSYFCKEINILSILDTPEKTLALPYIDPDVMMQLTDSSDKPIEIYVEDDLSEEIINDYIFKINASKYIGVSKFGVASNAFGVLAGKLLLGHDISNTLCVLDGDVFLEENERVSEIERHLGGGDKKESREHALNNVVWFSLKNKLPKGDRGAPEYNHKLIFENLQPSSEQMRRLQLFSKQINSLKDWHSYYDELSRISSIRDSRTHVLEYLSSSEEWGDYLNQVKEWILRKVKDHGFYDVEV